MKTYSDQQLMQLIDQAPPAVQDRVSDPRTALEIAAMGRRKNLHVDQIGKIAEMNRNLLLGLVNPQEFLQELIAAGMTELVARQIMTEINQQIFIPLREKMKNAATGTPQQPQRPRIEGPVPQARPQPAQPAPPRPAVPGMGAPQPTSHFHLENKLPPAPPVPPARPVQIPTATAALATPVPARQQPRPMGIPQTQGVRQLPPAPVQQRPINILSAEPKPQQPAVPARLPTPAVAPLPPKTILPHSMLPRPAQPSAQMSATRPMNVLPLPSSLPTAPEIGDRSALRSALAAVAPANLPGAMPPADIISTPKQVPTAPRFPSAPSKQYSADPYREPIEP